MSDQHGEQLTLAERDQLVAELAELEGPRRQEIVEAIAVARAHGDLSENFEYHAAKNEQGLLERRITILQSRLHNAEVIDEEAAAASGVVTVGSKVELEREDGEQMTLDISSVGGVSPESPVGRAVLGKKVGDKIVVEAPRGTWTRPRRLHRAVAAIYPGAVVHSSSVSAVPVEHVDELQAYARRRCGVHAVPSRAWADAGRVRLGQSARPT